MYPFAASLKIILPPVLLPPAVTGDVGNAENLDDIEHLLALADQDVRLAQFGNDLFGNEAGR